MTFSGVMHTSVSGMNAQASQLAAAADNIANTDTAGYKRASIEFSSLIPQRADGEYNSGGVLTNVRNDIKRQGSLEYTTSITDLAVNGNGFFVVSDASGANFLTRAGSFVPNGDGELVNAAGFALMGYSIANGNTNSVANGFAGLEVVNVFDLSLQATPSTSGSFQVNFPSNASVVAAADLPSTNSATADFTGKTSLVAIDNLGNDVILDVYSSKTAAETWEIAVYDRAGATNGGFPYASGPLTTDTLTYDASNGQLTGGSPSSISIPVPSGATVTLDMSQTSQLATDYTVLDVAVNGNRPSSVDLFEVTGDGIVYATYENGEQVALYQIPLADVPSPDNMVTSTGNVFQPTDESGDIQISFAESGGLGTIVSGALEESTVDLAEELTSVIQAQRNYTANSRVFQTGSELMDVLVNLSR